MTRILSPQERIDLQQRHKKERDKHICDRIKAVLRFDKRYSYTKIAEILLLYPKYFKMRRGTRAAE